MRRLLLTGAIVGVASLTGILSAKAIPAASARAFEAESPIQKIEYVCRGDRCWWRGPRRYRGGVNEFGCPYGYTIQDGVCKPYVGPVTPYYYGGSARYPCGRPGWTVQDGVCKPYRGY
jgi:hypothetical protein